ncbi:MAG: hypothetical protein Q8K60_09190, partial [Parachlamydiaceae bacterium]|nr:hypothetical protein [Parachlamydiaceae bacterium]
MNSSSNISNSNNNISNNDQNVGFKNQSQPKKIITSVDDLNPFKDQDEVEVIEKKIQNEIKIEQNSSKSNKRSVVVLNFFKKIFGIAILTDEQKEQIKSFNKEKDLFKKDFKSLFSLFNKLKKFEKTKENELPNQSSLKLVQTNLNAQGLILIQMGMRISRMNQSSLAINEISSKFKKYSDLSKQLEGMNQQYQKLNKRLIINRSLMDLEQTIVKYRDVIKNSSFGSFDAYSRILNQKGIIENQLRNAIQQRPELLRNQEIVRILKAKELSPAAIKQLVKLSYPKMSPYVNRLMNQLDLIKESRLDGLMKQQKKIDNLSSQITVLNKYVEKKEKQLNKWSFITYI